MEMWSIPAQCELQNLASQNDSSLDKETVASFKGRQHCNTKLDILYFQPQNSKSCPIICNFPIKSYQLHNGQVSLSASM